MLPPRPHLRILGRTAGIRYSVRGPLSGDTLPAYSEGMWTVLVILLVAWAVLSVVGFFFEGLFWLAVIGIILFVGTLVFGFVRRGSRKV